MRALELGLAIVVGTAGGLGLAYWTADNPTAQELTECSEARHALFDARIAFNKRTFENQGDLGEILVAAMHNKSDKCYWED